jgi:hypothetical protein
MIHPAWQKMVVIRVLSEIESKRQSKNQKTEKYKVHITNMSIYNDLKYVLGIIDGYRKIYIKLFEDMSNFDFMGSSSVTDGYDTSTSTHGDVKLYEHTLGTFDQMVAIVNSSNDYKIQKDLYLLIALLHDFGKSHKLCEHYKIVIGEDNHCIRSAKYFKKITNESEELEMDHVSFKIIYDTLFTHHKEWGIDDLKQNNKFLVALKQADGNARATEITNKESLV